MLNDKENNIDDNDSNWTDTDSIIPGNSKDDIL